LGKALAAVRADVVHPDHPRCGVKKGDLDTTWLPAIGDARLILITRDKRIRYRPAEKRLMLAHGVRAVFLTEPATRPVGTSFDSSSATGKQSRPWNRRPGHGHSP